MKVNNYDNKINIYTNVLEIVKSVPDIREEKVNKIKKSFQNGTYNVSNEDFINKILKKL